MEGPGRSTKPFGLRVPCQTRPLGACGSEDRLVTSASTTWNRGPLSATSYTHKPQQVTLTSEMGTMPIS